MFAILACLLTTVLAYTPSLITYPNGDLVRIGEQFNITWVSDPHWFSPYMEIFMPDGTLFDFFFGGFKEFHTYRFPSYSPLGNYTLKADFALTQVVVEFEVGAALPATSSTEKPTSIVTISRADIPSSLLPVSTTAEDITTTDVQASSIVILPTSSAIIAASSTIDASSAPAPVSSAVAAPVSSAVVVPVSSAAAVSSAAVAVESSSVTSTHTVESSAIYPNVTSVHSVAPVASSAPALTSTKETLHTYTITTYGHTYTITTNPPNAGAIASWSKLAAFGALAAYVLA
ncbi:hypothetical protein DASB73_019820 [Starmerella bacillaris]|uniref:Uncharacterized protein n=1 Tax=Starmerella bacillaris TaxID=1247836 RepID=A0AAV5RHF6_STABA|nr:hypothetical protein DASB73_019820 [Starmerella bacillaris]